MKKTIEMIDNLPIINYFEYPIQSSSKQLIYVTTISYL